MWAMQVTTVHSYVTAQHRASSQFATHGNYFILLFFMKPPRVLYKSVVFLSPQPLTPKSSPLNTER